MSRIDRLSATLSLEADIVSAQGVSNARRKALSKIGVHTIRDLLSHYPRRYIDLTRITRIADAQLGSSSAVIATVVDVRTKSPRRNLPIVEIVVNDGSATLIASFFRQPWMKDKAAIGDTVVMVGKVEFSYGYLRMSSPFIEVTGLDPSDSRTLGMIPVHPATQGITPVQIRSIIKGVLGRADAVFDPIPIAIRMSRSLASRSSAIRNMHFPKSNDDLVSARNRLVYEQLLLMQLFLMMSSYDPDSPAHAKSHTVDGQGIARLRDALPFALTGDQEAAVSEVLQSLASEHATSRLLLGDVGTGKTIVAAFAMAAAFDSGTQAMLMAPTEVLAEQHYATMAPLLEMIGMKCGLLTGSTDKTLRARMLEEFAAGDTDALIGTHALLENDVVAHDLTIVVIDEQQRFGVEQREKLIAKGISPDALYLTATPIPRSLALAIFGGLELTFIRECPGGGTTRNTHVLGRDERGVAYEEAKKAIGRGEQVYVVCPLIGIGAEERKRLASDPSGYSDTEDDEYQPSGTVVIEDLADFENDDSASAVREAEFLQKNVFADGRVELLHGGMPSDQKRSVMEAFRSGEIDVLVSTTVIEVGVDVPNATVMIIEDADRFGLSQLHQLRGRIGRSGLDSTAFLISASGSPDAIKRLKKLEETDDGFEISEFDLSLRREGDLLGYRQSGRSILKLVDIIRDSAIIEQAHEDAKALLRDDPRLESEENAPLAREIRLVFGDDTASGAG